MSSSRPARFGCLFLLSGLIVLGLTFMPGHGTATPPGTEREEAHRDGKVNSRAEASGVATYGRQAREAVKPPPPIKVTPLRDGRFLLEPLQAPPKTIGPSSSRFPQDDSGSFPALYAALSHSPVPYARGGSLETGVATDCSGFVQFVYRHGFSVNLPRTSAAQAQVGQAVTHSMDFAKLLPGDLLLFSDRERPIGHAGIYLGKGLMIHASSKRGKVVITDIRQGYYFDNFVVAKRFFKEPGPKLQALPRPRLVESNPVSPHLPSPIHPVSKIKPVVAAKMGGLFNFRWPWEYQRAGHWCACENEAL